MIPPLSKLIKYRRCNLNSRLLLRSKRRCRFVTAHLEQCRVLIQVYDTNSVCAQSAVGNKDVLQCRPEVLHPQSFKDSIQLQERLFHTHVNYDTRFLENKRVSFQVIKHPMSCEKPHTCEGLGFWISEVIFKLHLTKILRYTEHSLSIQVLHDRLTQVFLSLWGVPHCLCHHSTDLRVKILQGKIKVLGTCVLHVGRTVLQRLIYPVDGFAHFGHTAVYVLVP